MTKANEFFDELGETISKTARDLSERAEVMYETQKIRSKISGEERIVEKAQMDIGNLIYQRYLKGEALDEEIETLCEEMKQHRNRARILRDKVAQMKGEKICPNCEKTMGREMTFCPHCGTQYYDPEQEAKADEAAETVPEEAAPEAEEPETASDETEEKEAE